MHRMPLMLRTRYFCYKNGWIKPVREPFSDNEGCFPSSLKNLYAIKGSWRQERHLQRSKSIRFIPSTHGLADISIVPFAHARLSYSIASITSRLRSTMPRRIEKTSDERSWFREYSKYWTLPGHVVARRTLCSGNCGSLDRDLVTLRRISPSGWSRCCSAPVATKPIDSSRASADPETRRSRYDSSSQRSPGTRSPNF